jgi:hypothetical protein
MVSGGKDREFYIGSSGFFWCNSKTHYPAKTDLLLLSDRHSRCLCRRVYRVFPWTWKSDRNIGSIFLATGGAVILLNCTG